MNSTAIEHDLITDPAVRRQALSFLFTQLPGVTTIQFSFPLAVVALYWNYIDRGLLLGWLAGLFTCYALRIVMARAFNRKAEESDLEFERWGLYFTLTSFVVGIFWGAAGALFYVPEQTTLETLLYVIIIGSAAGQIIVTANWLPAFYAYNGMALGILILHLLLLGDVTEQVLATLLFLFLLMIIRVAHQARRVIYEGIQLRFENLDLIRKLKQEKLAAEQANMAKTRFLASANHDLRQPVHAIKLLAYALKTELSSARSKSLFSNFDASIQGLSDLLESLLDLSKLDAGIISPTVNDFELNTVFNQLLGEFLPLAREKQLKYSVRPTPLILSSDSTLLTNLLRNLLANAFRYVSHGGILMAARTRYGRCVIEIWDTGPGIPSNERARIFEPFYQIDNSERDKARGLGLGLAICRQLANILNATLDFRSQPGKGSVFRISLPCPPLSSTSETNTVGKHSSRLLTETIEGCHVLVVDDEPQVRVAMRAALESLGMTCDTAEGPQQALDIIQQHGTPDYILCDHRLRGGLTSLDLIEQLKQHLKTLPPLLIITGDTAPERLQEAGSSGYPVLHKPVDMDELQRAMATQKLN